MKKTNTTFALFIFLLITLATTGCTPEVQEEKEAPKTDEIINTYLEAKDAYKQALAEGNPESIYEHTKILIAKCVTEHQAERAHKVLNDRRYIRKNHPDFSDERNKELVSLVQTRWQQITREKIKKAEIPSDLDKLRDSEPSLIPEAIQRKMELIQTVAEAHKFHVCVEGRKHKPVWVSFKASAELLLARLCKRDVAQAGIRSYGFNRKYNYCIKLLPKEILAVRLKSSNGIENIKSIERDFYGILNEETREMIKIRYGELNFEDIVEAVTIEEAEKAYRDASKGNEDFALKEWGKKVLAKLNSTTTIEGLETLFRKSPHHLLPTFHAKAFNIASRLGIKAMEDLYWRITAHERPLYTGGNFREKVFKVWLGLCKTTEDYHSILAQNGLRKKSHLHRDEMKEIVNNYTPKGVDSILLFSNAVTRLCHEAESRWCKKKALLVKKLRQDVIGKTIDINELILLYPATADLEQRIETRIAPLLKEKMKELKTQEERSEYYATLPERIRLKFISLFLQ